MTELNREIPLQVSTILDDTVGQGADLNDEEFLSAYCPDSISVGQWLDSFRIIEDNIDSIERLRELILDYPSVYHTAFSRYLELTPGEWNEEFGEPPEGLESWEPIQSFYTSELIVDVDERESSVPSSIKQYHENSDSLWILKIQCDYASELSAVGYLSRNQAVAYILNAFGYPTSRISDIMGKPDGTASSHLTRGKNAVQRMRKAVELVDNIEHDRPPLMKTYAEMIGRVYVNHERGAYARVVNLYRTDEFRDSFVLGIQESTGRERKIDPDTFLNEWEHTPDEKVEFPELQDLELGDKEQYLDHPLY